MAEVVVVGAGVGGLAAAIRLRAAGHDVVVLERRGRAGGKLDAATDRGFTWETGPSLLTLPGVFDDLFAAAGHRLTEHVDLVRLDPICRYRFADGTTFDHRADLDDAAAAAESFAGPGAGDEWRRFMAHAESVWDVAERTFFAGPMESPLRLLQRMRSPRDLLAIDGTTTLHRRAASIFTDPRLVQYVDRYATYSGSSPFRAPGTLSCIAHIEQALGAWYVTGGLGALRDAIVAVALDTGVDIRLDTDVAAITRTGDRATGVRLADGDTLAADAVVADVDALHLYRDLLPHPRARRRTEAAPRSTSGYVLLLGVDGATEGLAHHNLWFGADYEAEFDQLSRRGVPADDPSVYVCVSSVTDPTQAPDGAENWFVLVNTPPVDDDLDGYGDHVLEVLARRGVDLAGRVRVRHDRPPSSLVKEFRTAGGAIYGTSSDGTRAAFVRPRNRTPIPGLFLCGGSSHPGGGLPLVAISGAIAAKLVNCDRAP